MHATAMVTDVEGVGTEQTNGAGEAGVAVEGRGGGSEKARAQVVLQLEYSW